MGHGQGRHQHKMLVDHANPGPDGIRRRTKRLQLAIDGDAACIRLVEAVELAHQGTFAGSIFPKQCMHFAGAHIEANLGICQHTGEALNDIAHLDVLDAAGLVCLGC